LDDWEESSDPLLSCDTDVVGSMHNQEMSDISDPLLSCDADVAGSGATLDHNSMYDQDMSDISDLLLSCDADVAGSGATLNHNSMHSGSNVLLSEENIPHSSSASTLDIKAAAIALSGLFSMIEYANKPVLIHLAKNHNVQLPSHYSLEVLRELIIFHLCHGECAESDADACMQQVTSFYMKSDISYVLTKLNFQLQILSSILYLVRVRPLRRILSSLHVLVEPGLRIKKLRSKFRKYLTRLNHGKRSEDTRNSMIAQEQRLRQEKEKIQQNWPQLIPDTLKKKIVKIFHEQTSSEALGTFTCASCSSSTLKIERKSISLSDINIDLLKASSNLPIQIPMPCDKDTSFANCLIDPDGIAQDETGNPLLQLCKTCYNALRHEKKPPLSLANGTYLGPVPPELLD